MPHPLRFFAGIVVIALPLGLIGCGGGGSSGGGGSGNGDAEMLVTNNSCVTCHSPNNTATDLSGNPKDLISLYGKHAFGRNLTPDKTTGLGTWTTQQIKDAITKGKRNDGSQLCTVMPIFATPCNMNEQMCYPPLSDADLTTVVDYLQGLKAVSNQVKTSTCSQ